MQCDKLELLKTPVFSCKKETMFFEKNWARVLSADRVRVVV